MEKNDSPFTLDSFDSKKNIEFNNIFSKINIKVDNLMLILFFLMIIIFILYLKDNINYENKKKYDEDNLSWI